MSKDSSFLVLDLPCEDIVLCKIFPRLQLKDCINLLKASLKFRKLVIAYFNQLKEYKTKDEYPLCPLEDLMILAINTSSLRFLDLSGLMFDGPMMNLNSDGYYLFKRIVRTFLANNKQLVHVDLSYTNLVDTDLYNLIYCENLQTLNLDGCSWLTREFLVTIRFHCPNVVVSNKIIQRKNAFKRK